MPTRQSGKHARDWSDDEIPSPTEQMKEYLENVKQKTYSSEYIIHKILNEGVDPNVQDKWGRTPLMVSSLFYGGDNRKDDVNKGVDFLLGLPNINVSVRDNDGENLIDMVVNKNDSSFFGRLLEYKSVRRDINTANEKGMNLIHNMCLGNCTRLQNFKMVLSVGADPCKKSLGLEWTAFHFAIHSVHRHNATIDWLLQVFKLFFQFGFELGDTRFGDVDGRCVLHWAAISVQNAELIKLLLDHGESRVLHVKDKYGKTPIDYAREHGNIRATAVFQQWHA
jgi:hypothetical protein